jgi:hypothetical protein
VSGGGKMFTKAKELIAVNKKLYRNLLNNGNFAIDSNSDGLADGWSCNGTGKSVANNVQSFTPSAQYQNLNQGKPGVNNDIFYGSGYVKSSKTTTALYLRRDGGQQSENPMYHSGNGDFTFLSSRMTLNATGQAELWVIELGTNFAEIQVKECVLINLTAEFGAGNEPDKAWCDANIPQNIIW